MQQVNIGILAAAQSAASSFCDKQRLLSSRLGIKIGLLKIAVKALDEPRPYPIPASLMTTDWAGVVNNAASPCCHRTRRWDHHRQDDDSDRAQTGQAGHHGQQGAAFRAWGGDYSPAGTATPISITKPAWPGAFPLSRPCARALPAIASPTFTASSTAPAITSSPA